MPRSSSRSRRIPKVERIFVNAAIKKALCRSTDTDRTWLRKVRPMWGHDYHFHIRMSCPAGSPDCRAQDAVPPGDGCGKELDWWFRDAIIKPQTAPPPKPKPVDPEAKAEAEAARDDDGGSAAGVPSGAAGAVNRQSVTPSAAVSAMRSAVSNRMSHTATTRR